MKKYIDQNFRGVVSIKSSNTIIYEDAFGFRDLPNQIPNTMKTKFGIASGGKVFTAVGILKLIEEGKLDFTTTIHQVLSLDLHGINPNITIEQLLTHTSGIPDYFDEDIMDDYEELWRDFPNYRIRSSKDLLPLFINKPMMFEPNEKFQYNNTGYVVLGLIIEEITNMTFEQYLHTIIFNPLKMENTGYFELDRLPMNTANGYVLNKRTNTYYSNIYSIDVKGSGAGGVFTNVHDLQTFWEALTSYKLLSKEMTTAMLCKQVKVNHAGYGYGVWLDIDGNPYIQGFDPGVSFISAYNANKKQSITFISNYADSIFKMYKNIKEIIGK